MNTLRRWLLASLSFAVLMSPAVFAADANVAGYWDFMVETQSGSGNPHFSLKQDGATLSGTYNGQLGAAPVTGTVSGNDVTITFTIDAMGNQATITYKGTVDGDTMKGTVSLGDLGEGTFTGMKK